MGGGGEDPQINVQIIRSELGATFSLGQKSGGVGQDGGIIYIIDLGFFFSPLSSSSSHCGNFYACHCCCYYPGSDLVWLIIRTRYECAYAAANHKSIVSISASPGAISWEISSFLAGTQRAALSVIFIRFELQLSQKDLVLAYVLKMAKLPLSKFTLSGSR